ncbi:Uncharacterized protein TPAR_00161 [Tolypocladium paradoxum]|uniref:DNA replication regulator Sld3 C-terminal domain-containing protein n=1 Tax=Tolypocladium paradoxum TaxID=94208 RepID=A0A2S4LB54_9HYPO|nr:Uncharacterized protein TPAR_00161 [Tolypocladium paradoxum]
MSSSAALDADASRPRSGILTPASGRSLNRRDGHGCETPESRKRRRADVVAMDHLLKPSIAVKVPHPHNLHVQPRALLPLMLVPREHLPLACIDLAASDHDLPQSRFYESHVKILDLESRLGSAPSVLVARNEPKGSVYAIERQDNGLYVMCRLGPWVDLDALARKATAVSQERLRQARPERREPSAVTALTTPRMHKEQKTKRAAIEAIQSLVRKRARSQSVSTFDDATKRDGPAEPDTSQSQLPSPEERPERQVESELPASTPTADASLAVDKTAESAPQHTADNIFDNIRTHYFEALYRSMGSLAYFAKGPLSRARSAFHLDLESDLDMADLIDFLKSLLLTTVQVDKKYRETIPDVVAKMRNHVESSDEGSRRRRRPRKMRLGKDGLYPMEEESIRKWWTATKPELGEQQASYSPSQIKSHVSLLRTRETQLQMILILEILALEPLKAADEVGEDALPILPGVESQQQEQSMAPPPPPKKRNKHNLPVLIDVHADRLTIWQSTASDEQLLLEDSQVSRGPDDDQVQQKASSEPLKDFCVDVILPFFAARLPELCDSINRKLGGPVIVSPPKSKSSKRSANKREQKPGAAAQRPAPMNPRRTLQRALSTEQHHRRSVSRGPGNVIALMRSATSTSFSGVKREGSEPVSLKALPKGEAGLPRPKQPSLSRSSSMTNLEDTKANKKALVEAELRDAISALRKPNRDVVGKAMAEAAERRVLTGQSAKKARKLPRSSLGSSIQGRLGGQVGDRRRFTLGQHGESHPSLERWALGAIYGPSSRPKRRIHEQHVSNGGTGRNHTSQEIDAIKLFASTRQRGARDTAFVSAHGQEDDGARRVSDPWQCSKATRETELLDTTACGSRCNPSEERCAETGVGREPLWGGWAAAAREDVGFDLSATWVG